MKEEEKREGPRGVLPPSVKLISRQTLLRTQGLEPETSWRHSKLQRTLLRTQGETLAPQQTSDLPPTRPLIPGWFCIEKNGIYTTFLVSPLGVFHHTASHANFYQHQLSTCRPARALFVPIILAHVNFIHHYTCFYHTASFSARPGEMSRKRRQDTELMASPRTKFAKTVQRMPS